MAIAPVVIDHQHRGLRRHAPFESVRGVTLHYTGGGLGVRGVIDTLLKRGLAYHYVVTRDGVVHRLVDPRFRVSHGGGMPLPDPPGGYPNRNTIAISLDNAGYEQWPQLRASVPSWPIHRDRRTGLRRRWQPYTEAQLESTAALVASILADHNLDESRIYTHEQFSSVKTDPGPAFPMVRFKRMVWLRRKPPVPVVPMLATLAPRLSDASTLVSSGLVAVTMAILGTAVLTRVLPRR